MNIFSERTTLIEIMNSLGTFTSAMVALVTYFLYRKSESRNTPKIAAEAYMDGGEKHTIQSYSPISNTIITIPISILIWNKGVVDSAIKNILILDEKGYPASTIDLTYGRQEKSASILAGQLIKMKFWIDLGEAKSDIKKLHHTLIPRDAMRDGVSDATQEKAQNLRIVIELTNHSDLIGYLPNPFWGTPKADPIYPHNPKRHLFSKIPFKIVTAYDFKNAID